MDTNRIELHVENIGGIDETEATFSPGITVLSGRNATNRTSLLRAAIAAFGGDDVSIKGAADEARVEMTIGEETYTRRFVKKDGVVRSDGDPYLEDSRVADLFAFLLESNEARRAVARGDDLRELVTEPVDTEEIESRIRELVQEREDIEQEIAEIDEQKRRLPDLEQRKTQIQEEISQKREELAEKEQQIQSIDGTVEEFRERKAEIEDKLSDLQEKRSELEDVRYDLETEEETLDELRSEKRDLESERDDLPEAPTGELDEIESELERLRSRKQSVESDINELQSIIEFNESKLEEESLDLLTDESDGEVTDRLLADESVRCWTCGTDVETEQIETTVEQLRERSREKFQTVQSIEDDLEDLADRQRELRQQRQRRDETEQKLRQLERDIEESESRIDRLRERRDDLVEAVDALDSDVEEVPDESGILEHHREANQLEHEIGKLEGERERIEGEISEIETRLDERADLKDSREGVQDEIETLRTKIERIERQSVELFNDHMETVLQELQFENLDRIWLERKETTVREGRRKVSESTFELNVVRSTDGGTTYEDTIDHLSESEREVTGLVFALAGYLALDVHEEVPVMLLDSIEAIDSERIRALLEYISEYTEYLVVALLPEDAAALDEDYRTEVTPNRQTI